MSLVLALTALSVLVGMSAAGQCKSLVVFMRVAVGIVLATMFSVWRSPHGHVGGGGEQAGRREAGHALLEGRERHLGSRSQLQMAAQAAERAVLELGGRGSLCGMELLWSHAVFWSVLWGAVQAAGW